MSEFVKIFTSEDNLELNIACPNVRSLHSIKCHQYTGNPSRALWYEWDHPAEGSRDLATIISSAQDFNWDRFIVPGKISIDIGGHSGDTAIPMGLFSFDRDTKQKGHVFIVEPNPAVIPVLDTNLAMNTHLANYYSLPVAITPHDVLEVELADHGNSQCNGGVIESGLSSDAAQKIRDVAVFRYKAPGVSMKTLFRTSKHFGNGQPIGFVKLDCEGYDKEILRPCRDLLSIDKPVLFVEWFEWFEDEDDIDLFAVIDSIDYVPLNPVTLTPSSISDPTSDILCIHKTKIMAEGIIA